MSSLSTVPNNDINFAGLRVLAVSPVSSYSGNNTSIHRIRALKSLGCHVQVIDSTLKTKDIIESLNFRIRNRLFRLGLSISLPDISQTCSILLDRVYKDHWDILWLERELSLRPDIIKRVCLLSPKTLIVGFSLDDMAGRHNQSFQFLQSLPLYDLFLTTKSFNVFELKALGCPDVCFIGNGYDPMVFRPIPVSSGDVTRLGGDIGFIGSYEKERAFMISILAASGFNVRVWGNGWENTEYRYPNLRIEGRPLYGDDFAKACAAFKINLGFLRKKNRDLQTTRSVEIPACAGFMLAERTVEHTDMFIEGKEAEFFSNQDELLEKCSYYLANKVARTRIAKGGYRRCEESNYSNAGRLSTIGPHLKTLIENKI